MKKQEARLNEVTFMPESTVLPMAYMESDDASPADVLDDGTELYILDIRHTPLRTKFLEEGATGIKPERIAAFLSAKGFVVAAERGVTVRADGKVLIYSDSDPTGSWETFTNEPTAEESTTAGPLVKLKAFKAKADKGTATAKDVADIVPVIVGAMLRAYGQE